MPKSEINFEEIQRRLDERADIRAQKAADRRAWWAKYYEQLAKSTPNQGGAKRSQQRKLRVKNAFRQR